MRWLRCLTDERSCSLARNQSVAWLLAINLLSSQTFATKRLLRGEIKETGHSTPRVGTDNAAEVLGENEWKGHAGDTIVHLVHSPSIRDKGEKEHLMFDGRENRKKFDKPLKKKRVSFASNFISDRISHAIKDYPILKTSLDGSRFKLEQLRNSLDPLNAYQILERIMDDIQNAVDDWSGKIRFQESLKRDLSVFELEKEKHEWKLLVESFQKELPELEDLLRMPIFISYHLKRQYQHTLEVQAFGIVNFLTKHEMLEEQLVQKWITKETIFNALLRHINGMCSPSQFMGHDLQDSLSQSEFSKHLKFILRLMPKNYWKHIEYKILKKELSLFQEKNTQADERLSGLIKFFLGAGFQHTQHTMSLKLDCERLRVAKGVANYLDLLQTSHIQTENSLETHGIFYEITNFLLKHHQQVFTYVFGSESNSALFFQKFKVLKCAIHWLKSAREMAYIAQLGLWSTEVDARNSKNLISLKKAANWSWNPRPLDKFFRDNFSIYLSKDKEEWLKYFQRSSIERNHKPGKYSTNVHDYLSLRKLGFPQTFGTNFLMRTLGKSVFPSHKPRNLKEKCISKVFLEDAYTWIDNLKFLQEQFDENKYIYLWNIKNIFEEVSKLGGENVSTGFKNWLEDSVLLQSTYKEIIQNCSASQNSWDEFSENLKILNHEIHKFGQHSKTEYFPEFVLSQVKTLSNGENGVEEIRSESENFPSHPVGSGKSIGFKIPTLKFAIELPAVQQDNVHG